MKTYATSHGVSFLLAIALLGGCGDVDDERPTIGDEPEIGSTSSELTRDSFIDYLAIRFCTGGDDKRSDSYFTFRYYGHYQGTVSTTNHFRGVKLRNNTCTGYVYWHLRSNRSGYEYYQYSDLVNLYVVHHGNNGGFGKTYDNWNLDGMNIWVRQTNGQWHNVWNPSGQPLHRFKGGNATLRLPFVAGP